jgi:hypothetical protein
MGQRFLSKISAVASFQDVAIPTATPCRNGDDRAALNTAVMRDGEAAVDALLDVHDFQDVGQFTDGDFAHEYVSVQVIRDRRCIH